MDQGIISDVEFNEVKSKLLADAAAKFLKWLPLIMVFPSMCGPPSRHVRTDIFIADQ